MAEDRDPEVPPEGASEEPQAASTEASRDEKIAELEEALEEKTREAAESYDRYLRQLAEVENFKKRMQREKGDAIRFANESFSRDLLPIVDNLERALGHAASGGNGAPLTEGVSLIVRMLAEVLERHGVETIDAPEGGLFDPETQEAVGTEESTEHQPNTVLRQETKGYRLGKRLLRAARVVVSRAPAATPPEDEPGSCGDS